MDGIWEPTEMEAVVPVTAGQFFDWCVRMSVRRNLIPGPLRCREVRITDDLEGLQAGRRPSVERIRQSLTALRHNFSFMPSLCIFR